MEKKLKLVLRGLAIEYERDGRGKALKSFQFYSLQVMDLLAHDGHDPAELLKVIQELETFGCIIVTHLAGEEGVSYTHFVLPSKGYAIGNPEIHADQRVGFYSGILKKAFLYSLSTLGVTGSPLASY